MTSAGSVAHTLMAMRGVWHDHLEAFHLDGTPVDDDPHGGQPGPYPYDNLVYIDFDGTHYRQTNVTFRGRPLHVRSFTATMRDGVLNFGTLGPDDPGHVGVSGGPGVLVFAPSEIDAAWQRYSEPDTIVVDGAHRTRMTFLYRDGRLVRTLTVRGVRLSPVADRCVAWDPRGAEGPVHDEPSTTRVFAENGRVMT